MEPTPESEVDELRPEYDLATLRGGERGKYFDRYQKRFHLVHLAPDVAEAFPTEESVNNALRMLMRLARQQVPPAPSQQ